MRAWPRCAPAWSTLICPSWSRPPLTVPHLLTAVPHVRHGAQQVTPVAPTNFPPHRGSPPAPNRIVAYLRLRTLAGEAQVDWGH
jgi:hypothetical protein